MRDFILPILAMVIAGLIIHAIFGFLYSGKDITSIFSGISLCKPNYVSLSMAIDDPTKEDFCKSACFNAYKVTSFKIENSTQGIFINAPYCYCDVNNCNPK